MNPQSLEAPKIKKGVTFVSGLFLNERSLSEYEGALIHYDQLGFINEFSSDNIIFSKFIVKPKIATKPGSSEKKARKLKTYTENDLNELMKSATESLHVYEYVKVLRINFVFHDEAIRHLARLTRVFVSSY